MSALQGNMMRGRYDADAHLLRFSERYHAQAASGKPDQVCGDGIAAQAGDRWCAILDL